eukprot:5553520-Pleurochrysis_carterae.AAC.1
MLAGSPRPPSLSESESCERARLACERSRRRRRLPRPPPSHAPLAAERVVGPVAGLVAGVVGVVVVVALVYAHGAEQIVGRPADAAARSQRRGASLTRC